MSVCNARHASRSGRLSGAWSTVTVATTSAGTDRRPRRVGDKSVNISSGREQPVTVRGQERVHRPLPKQMVTQRRRVEQLTTRTRRTPHPTSIHTLMAGVDGHRRTRGSRWRRCIDGWVHADRPRRWSGPHRGPSPPYPYRAPVAAVAHCPVWVGSTASSAVAVAALCVPAGH